ncbi:hypothetical protein V8C37DRAFT_74675 [Trichoderma ceciliae]
MSSQIPATVRPSADPLFIILAVPLTRLFFWPLSPALWLERHRVVALVPSRFLLLYSSLFCICYFFLFFFLIIALYISPSLHLSIPLSISHRVFRFDELPTVESVKSVDSCRTRFAAAVCVFARISSYFSTLESSFPGLA